MIRFRRRWIARCLMTLLVLALLAGLGGQARLEAQMEDWTVPYRPALLPEFQGDMAGYADAPRYDIVIVMQVTGDEATLTGHQTVIYTNRAAEPLSEIVFRLYPNFESFNGSLDVSRAAVDGAAVEPELDSGKTILTLPLEAKLQPGTSVTIDLDFVTTVPYDQPRLYGQFSYEDGVLALPNAYPVLSVYEPDDGWWKVDAHPQGDAVYSQTSFFTVSITAPSDLVVVTSGSEVDMVANDDGTLTHRYVAPLMREFAIMASAEYVALSDKQDGVTITLYYNPDLPNGKPSARAGLEVARETVRVYNEQFGSYPFSELDFVQTPTTAGGIEYPGLIVVAADIWNEQEEFFSFVIIHETAHQWWYSLVGDDQTLDPWMDEALAQFSVAVYIRETEGEKAYEAALESFRTQYTRYVEQADKDDMVIGLPVTEYPSNAYFYFVYQKGPLFFDALADEYGYEALIGALQDYFDTYRYEEVEPEDMQSSFEASLGEDLEPIFEEWVGAVPVG